MIFNDVFLYAEPTQEQIKQSICDGTGRWVMSGFLLYIHPPCPVDLNKVLKSSMESAEQVPCLLSVSHGFANAESWFPPVLCLSPFVFLLRKRGNKKWPQDRGLSAGRVQRCTVQELRLKNTCKSCAQTMTHDQIDCMFLFIFVLWQENERFAWPWTGTSKGVCVCVYTCVRSHIDNVGKKNIQPLWEPRSSILTTTRNTGLNISKGWIYQYIYIYIFLQYTSIYWCS